MSVQPGTLDTTLRNRDTERPGSETSPPEKAVDIYFSADIETDGPIPGPYSMLSFALVFAGEFDGIRFARPDRYQQVF